MNFNVLDATKADKNEVFSMANMGQDIKEAMTGGSVAVVGKNAVDTINILDGAVTPSKVDDEFWSCVGVEYTRKSVTVDDFAIGNEHLNGELLPEFLFFNMEIEKYHYDWLCFDESVSEFEFDYDQQDLYLVLSANDYDAYAICMSPVKNEATTGAVYTFTKTSKKQEQRYLFANLQDIPQSRVKMKKVGNVITIYSDGKQCLNISDIPNNKYGMGILLHNEFIVDTTTLKNLSIISIKNSIKDRIDEVEKDIKDRIDEVEKDIKDRIDEVEKDIKNRLDEMEYKFDEMEY